MVYSIARGSGPVLSSIVAILFLGERPGVLGILGIIAIGVGIFFLAGGSASEHQSCDHSWSLIGTSIATYTVWDKYVVSVIYVSQILLDLLATPLQALLLTPLLITALPTMKNHFVNSNQTLAFPTNQRKVKPPPTRFRSMFQDA